MPVLPPEVDRPTPRWAKVIDHDVCIGCHACSTACKSENAVPLSVNRTYVKYVDVGVFPDARRAFQVTRCNQCENPPCVSACPTSAMYQRPDGIVDFDKDICIGCKACIAACPYDAIFINPHDHSAEKCNFCAHRLDVGLEPACVVVCPTEAILVGDMNDGSSLVSKIVGREPTQVRRPEKETRPKLFYKGATQATLDPLAAARPSGELFLWSEQTTGGHHVVSGHPGPNGSSHNGSTPMDALLAGPARGNGAAPVATPASGNSAAAAMLAYDVPHSAPWDWRVSLYTWTKSIAAGVYLVAALLVLAGLMAPDAWVWQWAVPLVGGAFLGITGMLLIWDLEHPARFYYIFTRGRWGSWLVKGAWIIAAYSAVLGAHLAATLAGASEIQRALTLVGVPAALMTAVYTAYLFAQAKARDLWQSPLLPPHMAVQSVLAGAAALLLVGPLGEPAAQAWLMRIIGGAMAVHLLMVWGEVTLTHSTAHAKLATREMTRGRYARFFRAGVVLGVVAIAAPWLALVGAPVALLALLLHEHAYVQAGQSVPLA